MNSEEEARPLPEATVGRLHRYRRALGEAIDEGVDTVSSEDLARAAGVNSAQVRKDLSWVGSHGTRGVGYPAGELRDHLTTALGLDRACRVAIVGVGNLGRALAAYEGFAEAGFSVSALFDVDPARVGTDIAGCEVEHVDALEEAVDRGSIDIAILAVPAAAAAEVTERLERCGVPAVLNFAPTHLDTDLRVRRVDLSSELGVLAYYEHLEHLVPSTVSAPEARLDRGAAARHASPTADPDPPGR